MTPEERAALLALLRRLEFHADERDLPVCRVCCCRRSGQHYPNCELAAMIRVLQGAA